MRYFKQYIFRIGHMTKGPFLEGIVISVATPGSLEKCDTLSAEIHFFIPCSYRLSDVRMTNKNILCLVYFCTTAREMDSLLEYSITASLSESMSIEVKSSSKCPFRLATTVCPNGITIAGQWW